jgi:dolichol-phosphate mannosyltransferase
MEAGERAVVGRREAGGASRRKLLTLVVPTRNEAANIPVLVRELRESLSGIEYRVVFVDDSTDETPEVIRDLGEEDERITLIHRKDPERDGGLSTAVTTGIEAFAGMSEYTCVMDADLQHPPEKVREMLDLATGSDADVVVASRYAPGGSYTGLPGPLRRGVSVGSKYLAQVLFKEARKTSDPMAGFFLVRNDAISGIQFRPTGFKILLEILVCAPELKVVEVPLEFRARHAGISKATFNQGLEYLSHIGSLFWFVPSAGRFWKFALVGASGVLVNMATLVILAEYFHAHKVIAWMFAVGVSILSNFLLNNAFTWRDVRHSSRIHFLRRELRRLLPAPEVRERSLPLLRALQPARHSGRHERQLHTELAPGLQTLHPGEPRPRSPSEAHRRRGASRAEGGLGRPDLSPRHDYPRREYAPPPDQGRPGRDLTSPQYSPADPYRHRPPQAPPGTH